MRRTLSPNKLVRTNEALILGLNGHFNYYLNNYNEARNSLFFNEFDASFFAFEWLMERKRERKFKTLPKAIICDFTFLKEENFLFLKNVQSAPSLRAIPFIVINREEECHKIEALEQGVDDYYSYPVDWRVLRERIEFLQEFKTVLKKCKPKEQESIDFDISPVKRGLDIGIASLALLLLSPLMLLVAIAIRLESKGAAIYRSKRVGTGYRIFDFFKFRSMYLDADRRLEEFMHLNKYLAKADQKEGEGLFLKFSNDPRVTKVGRIIRKTSLDELPQLINVLKGDMSIVGNRPLPLYEAEQLTKDQWAGRFLAPAGLTGLWQVSKRGKENMSTEERINLDIAYAKRYNFWFDIKIMLRTLPAMIQKGDV